MLLGLVDRCSARLPAAVAGTLGLSQRRALSRQVRRGQS